MKIRKGKSRVDGYWRELTSRSTNIDPLPYLVLKVIARIIDSP